MENRKPVVSHVEPSKIYVSSDDSIRPRQHIRRNCQADLLGRLQIDDKLELVGCSTGMSAGLVPLRILSTNPCSAPVTLSIAG